MNEKINEQIEKLIGALDSYQDIIDNDDLGEMMSKLDSEGVNLCLIEELSPEDTILNNDKIRNKYRSLTADHVERHILNRLAVIVSNEILNG